MGRMDLYIIHVHLYKIVGIPMWLYTWFLYMAHVVSRVASHVTSRVASYNVWHKWLHSWLHTWLHIWLKWLQMCFHI